MTEKIPSDHASFYMGYQLVSGSCTEQDDEFSIGMIAFHEAIRGYTKERGAFVNYASMLILSRLNDYRRKEARHQENVSLYEKEGDDGLSWRLSKMMLSRLKGRMGTKC